MLHDRRIELRVDALRQLKAVLGRLGSSFNCDESVKEVELIQPQVFGHRIPHGSIEMDIVAKVYIVASKRTVDLDRVVSGQIPQVECLCRTTRGRDVELEDHIYDIFVEP